MCDGVSQHMKAFCHTEYSYKLYLCDSSGYTCTYERNHTTFTNSTCRVCMPLVSDIITSGNIVCFSWAFAHVSRV